MTVLETRGERTIALIDRRQFIAGLTVGSMGGLAGCSTLTGWASSDGSQLGRVEIVNRDNSGHVVEVRVELHDDSTVHQQAYNLPADDPQDEQIPGEVVERSWPDSPLRVRIAARLKGRQWQSVSASDQGYPTCFSVLINIDTNGQLALLTSSNTNRCER